MKKTGNDKTALRIYYYYAYKMYSIILNTSKYTFNSRTQLS